MALHPTRPSVVFLLLDCGRADRFGAWGGDNPTTPVLDELAAQGTRFAWHFANAHATRASMPQMMSGRYYASNILRPFQPHSSPHEYMFRAREHAPPLLPAILRRAGFHVIGTSAHAWVVPECRFGEGFDRLDFLPSPQAAQAYVKANVVIDHAIGQWRDRPTDRPTFLYVHLMDLHMPRWIPASGCRFLPAGMDWRARFDDGSQPRFGTRLRHWDPSAADDFTADDRRTFAAIYDTLLAYTDTEIGRLLAALRVDDPDLENTLVVVTADHGEQLGEEARIGHVSSLIDGVQRVPLVFAGGGVGRNQVAHAISEHVDLVPTLLRWLHVDDAPGSVDGCPLLDPRGAPVDHEREGAYYAWLRYQGLRTRTRLLRVPPAGSPESRGPGHGEVLWRVSDGPRRVVGARRESTTRERLRSRITERLGARAQAFLRGFEGSVGEAFAVPTPFWVVSDARIRSLPPTAPLKRSPLGPRGWVFVRDSLHFDGGRRPSPLHVHVEAPPGTYDVAVGTVPVGKRALLGSQREWRRKFQQTTPTEFVPLGRAHSDGGGLTLEIPPGLAATQRLLEVRLVPPGGEAAQPEDALSDEEREHHERLRALGYVE